MHFEQGFKDPFHTVEEVTVHSDELHVLCSAVISYTSFCSTSDLYRE